MGLGQHCPWQLLYILTWCAHRRVLSARQLLTQQPLLPEHLLQNKTNVRREVGWKMQTNGYKSHQSKEAEEHSFIAPPFQRKIHSVKGERSLHHFYFCSFHFLKWEQSNSLWSSQISLREVRSIFQQVESRKMRSGATKNLLWLLTWLLGCILRETCYPTEVQTRSWPIPLALSNCSYEKPCKNLPPASTNNNQPRHESFSSLRMNAE